jgi:hypothetical protein
MADMICHKVYELLMSFLRSFKGLASHTILPQINKAVAYRVIITLTRENEYGYNLKNFEQFSSFKCRTDRFGNSFSLA